MLKTLNARIIYTVIGIVCFTVLTSFLLVQWQTAYIVESIQQKNAKDLLNAITNTVDTEYSSIQFHRQAILDQRKSDLKNVVDIAHTVLSHYFQKYQSGLYSQKQAKQLSKQTLKKMRWADNVGYYWINDTSTPTPIMVMHPTLPELEGMVLDDPDFNCALGRGENLFRASNQICQAEGEGYVDYLWPKPTKDGGLTESLPKLSFVRLFQPWEWIIGSGVYIDDIESETLERLNAVKKELSETFSKIHVGENSYMFLFTSEKEMLIHPNLQGEDFSEQRNPETGSFLFDDIMLAAKTKEKIMEYRWKKPSGGSNETYDKILYVSYFEPLKWYICISYYQDEVKAPIRDLGYRMTVLSVFFLFLALLLSFLLGRSLTSPLKKLTIAARNIDKEGVDDIDIPISGSKETRDLGHILSQSLVAIKEAERNLKQQLEFTESLITAIPVPIFYKNTLGHYISCNRAFADFVGTSIPDVQGKTVFDFWPKDLAEKYHQLDLELIENLKPQSLEILIPDADGEQHDVIINNEIFLDDTGSVSGIVGSFFDISDRIEAEEAVRESELKYRQLVENAHDLIFIAQDGVIVFSNNKTSELTGYEFEELCSIPFQELIHPDDRAMVVDRYVRRLKGDKDIPSTYQFKMINKYNVEHTLLLSSVLVEWDNKPANLCFARDITEQKKLETAFIQAQKLDAIGKLAGGVAHDFNNMLAGILGATQLLKSSNNKLNEKEKNYLDLIIKTVSRAGDLTTKLLAFGRKGIIMSTAIDLHSIISDTIDILLKTIDKKISISFDKSAENTIIIGDTASIQNALMNLGINASHAMPEGGKLGFVTKNIQLSKEYCNASPFDIEPGLYVYIEIVDTGGGISPQNINNIFEPFFTTKKENEGSGLGLSAVYGTIQDHHGTIAVYSEVGVGTVFHIYLPCSNLEVEQTPKEEIVLAGKGNILLVDDEEMLQSTGKSMLEGMGYAVIVAENGRKAMEVFKDQYNEIDLVIMDMIMPEMNGYETFLQMKAIDNDCLIIISSGFTKDESLKELKKMGLAGFIRKPFTDYELSVLLNSVLNENK